MIIKKIVSLIFAVGIILFSNTYLFASEPSFSIYPSNGVVKDASKGFTIDVLINTGNYSITKAMFTLKFNPDQVRVVNAHRNNSLFDQWPEDESTIDNQVGVIMLTGFTQSGGSSTLYQSSGVSEVMARLEFEVVTEEKEDIYFDFLYSGTDTLFSSVITRDGSPPQNVLATQPQGAKFSISGYRSPDTAIDPSYLGVIFGIVSIAVGIFITNIRTSTFRKRKGTVVLYE
jgi:hypothetical protein